MKTSYDASRVHVTDPLEHLTVVDHDPLGRPVTITDAALGMTSYT